ncbi:Hypothetical predicted protein [Olea europaea subsp. europaea]|uniref:DUF4283 domain-containing protein n=1 Tax=Olea europaea subsp. europaea TaxID=158383 RepID=A0A8S0V1V5_OLEEU|nr:Hypothetical predicted protein [Olea europaea subsp. europaea]
MWGLKEIPIIGIMDAVYVLIQLKNEIDFCRVWARKGRSLMGANFGMFKWALDFAPKKEPSIATQWIFLLGLPMHLYRPDCLGMFASLFGWYMGCERETRMEKSIEGGKTKKVDAAVAEPSGEEIPDGIEKTNLESQIEQQAPLQIVEQSEQILVNHINMVEKNVNEQIQSNNQCQDNVMHMQGKEASLALDRVLTEKVMASTLYNGRSVNDGHITENVTTANSGKMG